MNKTSIFRHLLCAFAIIAAMPIQAMDAHQPIQNNYEKDAADRVFLDPLVNFFKKPTMAVFNWFGHWGVGPQSKRIATVIETKANLAGGNHNADQEQPQVQALHQTGLFISGCELIGRATNFTIDAMASSIESDCIPERLGACARYGLTQGAKLTILLSPVDLLFYDCMSNWVSLPLATCVFTPYASALAITAYMYNPKARRFVSGAIRGVPQQAVAIAGQPQGQDGSLVPEILEKIGLPEEYKEIIINNGLAIHRTGATLVKEEYKRAWSDVKSEISAEFISLRADIKADVLEQYNEAKATLKTEFQAAKDELNQELNNIKQGVDQLDGFTYKMLWKYGGTATLLSVASVVVPIITWYAGDYIVHKLKNPDPVVFHATSEKSRWQRLKDYVFGHAKLPEMIYAPELAERFDGLTKSTVIINKRINEGKENIYYRNVLLEGPPGTGKTFFARNMIKAVNQQTGGRITWKETDGSALLKGGIKAIDEMFAWLNKQNGACVFIDEADTLFPDRDNLQLNDDQGIVLNHLLHLMGDRSKRFFFILATNRKVVFDKAMQRRIDDVIHVPLPAHNERKKVLELYCNKFLFNEKANDKPFIESAQAVLTDSKLESMAQRTQGLSNGDLQGIVNTIRTDADITDDGLVTEKIVDTVVDRYIEKMHTMMVKAEN